MPPNILLIVADDMGKEQFSDEGLSGALPGYPTLDNIQAIGNRGVKYSRAYSTAFCSPTRACLHTGRYAGRTGLGDIVELESDEPLFEGEFTIAELIKEYTANLYSTAMIGKYHLGNSQNGGLFAPNFQGWDFTCVTERNLELEPILFPVNTVSASLYNFPYSVNGEARRNVDTYCGTWVTSNVLDWIRRQGARPWLCVASYHMPHEPHGRPPLTHFDGGVWSCPLPEPPSQSGPGIIPYFKAACEALDYEVGQLLLGIEEYSGDLFDNTMVIFLPDNGTEGGELGNESYPDDSLYNANHGKRSCYEPGINVPLYIDGPLITTGSGTVIDGLVGAVDLFGLIAEMAGVVDVNDYMLRRKGVVIDSVPMLNTLSGTTTTNRSSVFSEIFQPNGTVSVSKKIGHRAIMSLTHKLYRKATSAIGPAEFYDRVADLKEVNNLTPGGSTASLTAAQLAEYNALNDEMARLYVDFDNG